jgi:hypothetical protein
MNCPVEIFILYIPSEDPPGDCGNGITYFRWIWTATHNVAMVRGGTVIIKKGFQMASIFGAGIFGPFDFDGIKNP